MIYPVTIETPPSLRRAAHKMTKRFGGEHEMLIQKRVSGLAAARLHFLAATVTYQECLLSKHSFVFSLLDCSTPCCHHLWPTS